MKFDSLDDGRERLDDLAQIICPLRQTLPGDDAYVAWLHYIRDGELTRIRVCDSDAKGAFKVYRR